jgi:hypothetical protein
LRDPTHNIEITRIFKIWECGNYTKPRWLMRETFRVIFNLTLWVSKFLRKRKNHSRFLPLTSDGVHTSIGLQYSFLDVNNLSNSPS